MNLYHSSKLSIKSLILSWFISILKNDNFLIFEYEENEIQSWLHIYPNDYYQQVILLSLIYKLAEGQLRVEI